MEIEISNLIESIGAQAFSFCKLLEPFSLPPLVKSIEENTFYYCKKLSSFIIPKNTSLSSIESQAFGICHILNSFTIPKDIYHIGDFAFHQCYKLNNFTYLGFKEPQISNNSFSEFINLKEIYVNESYRNDYFGNIKVKIIG